MVEKSKILPLTTYKKIILPTILNEQNGFLTRYTIYESEK